LKKNILLQPIGLLPDNVIDTLLLELPKIFDANFNTESMLDMPSNSLDELLKLHDSHKILKYLTDCCSEKNYDKILGICDVQSFSGNMKFIFGEAPIDGKIGAVYLSMLKKPVINGNYNAELFLQRTVKEAIHELGHSLGLKHCNFNSCVMYFSKSLQVTDNKNSHFCGKCDDMLKRIINSSFL